MLTLTDAQTRGWTLAVDGENGKAHKDGVEQFQVTSGIPLFALLNEIADAEGIDRIVPTPENILAATGETYTEPAADVGPARAAKVAEIDATLRNVTDPWVLRAYEEGVPLPSSRQGYRELLRGLRHDALTSSDPAAIVVPEPPTWGPG